MRPTYQGLGGIMSTPLRRCRRRCPLTFWFPSNNLRTVHPFDLKFFLVVGLYERKVPFDDGCRWTSNMATMAAILNLVSVEYLENCSPVWPEIFLMVALYERNVPFHDGCRQTSKMAAILNLLSDIFIQVGGICYALRCSCFKWPLGTESGGFNAFSLLLV